MMTSFEVVVVMRTRRRRSWWWWWRRTVAVTWVQWWWLGFLFSYDIVYFCMYTNKWHSWEKKCIYLIFQAQQLECEQGPLQRRIVELENCVSSLSQQLQQEQKHRQEENQLLARHLAERTQHIEVLVQQLEDQKGENEVLRRKQASALKVRIDVNISLWIIF